MYTNIRVVFIGLFRHVPCRWSVSFRPLVGTVAAWLVRIGVDEFTLLSILAVPMLELTTLAIFLEVTVVTHIGGTLGCCVSLILVDAVFRIRLW